MLLVLLLVLEWLFLMLDDDRFGHGDLFSGKPDIAGVAQELPTQRQHARTVMEVAVLTPFTTRV